MASASPVAPVVTSAPGVASFPINPFRYKRSRHSTSSVICPLSSSGMCDMPEILTEPRSGLLVGLTSKASLAVGEQHVLAEKGRDFGVKARAVLLYVRRSFVMSDDPASQCVTMPNRATVGTCTYALSSRPKGRRQYAICRPVLVVNGQGRKLRSDAKHATLIYALTSRP